MPQTSTKPRRSKASAKLAATTKSKQQHVTSSSATTRRKRKAAELSEDTENYFPAKKIPANVAANTATIATTTSTSILADICDVSSPPSVPCTPLPTTSPLKAPEISTWSDLRASTCFLTPSTSRRRSNTLNDDDDDEDDELHDHLLSPPLPSLPWADSTQVWSLMCLGDQKSATRRDPQMFLRHPTLQPRMRAILLDWLIEVCEVYKLHRETYYLAMDYIDRYLAGHKGVPKNQLQLIGITCLFVAAKVEEIYPPKIAEFAYVTDGACTEQEILGKELIILKGLGWNLTPVTPPGWLNVYMQAESADWAKPGAFIYAQYGGLRYSQAAQLIDLATLDEGSLKFSYSQLAAAAVFHTQGKETALRVSRLTWEQLSPCVKWLNGFALTVAEDRAQQLLRASSPRDRDSSAASGLRHAVPNLVVDESHRIQTHAIDLEMLEAAQQRQSHDALLDCLDFDVILEESSTSVGSSTSGGSSNNSPDKSAVGILTPPSSSHKHSVMTPARQTIAARREPYT